MRIAALLLLALACAPCAAATPATLRVDVQHAGDATAERFALERVVVEPLPWAGNPDRPVDDSGRGAQRFDVLDDADGRLLYSRGYSTVFGEWRTTDEARTLQRSFQESLRFPMPSRPVRLNVYSRDAANRFVRAWSVRIDPASQDIDRAPRSAPATPIAIGRSGDPSHKVDLLILGDGYTAAELGKFEADARRFADRLFTVSPFRERAQDFNVWALAVPVPVPGVSRPSTGIHRASATGLRYDIFGSERYALTLDNRAFRELAQYAPYDVVEIVFNDATYGGGGIFGQFSTVAADNDWSDYVFVHEFGHHFAGLADEYYTAAVAYAPAQGPRAEPWEPNVTADATHPKWPTGGAPRPTPWPKAAFEAYERDVQAKRARLRAERRPEAEMSALFRDEQAHVDAMFARSPYRRAVGAFEGANYEATGYYRPQMQCIMFSRADAFCDICRRAIEAVIDLDTASGATR